MWGDRGRTVWNEFSIYCSDIPFLQVFFTVHSSYSFEHFIKKIQLAISFCNAFLLNKNNSGPKGEKWCCRKKLFMVFKYWLSSCPPKVLSHIYFYSHNVSLLDLSDLSDGFQSILMDCSKSFKTREKKISSSAPELFSCPCRN